MAAAAREENGFMMVELLVASFVLATALLALMAGYDSAFLSLHKAAGRTAAANLANNQLELYSALSYTAIGLDTTTLSSVKASNATYVSDDSSLDDAANATDHTIASCGTASQCLPVQSLVGSDGKTYTVETFVRDLLSVSYNLRSEREVTVLVRDPNSTGSPELARMSAAFDAGPS
jgi:Tfp pilus assembly protein PilE